MWRREFAAVRRKNLLTRGVEPPRVSPYGPEPYASAIPPRELEKFGRLKCAACSTAQAGCRSSVRLSPAAVCGRGLRVVALCALYQANEEDRRNWPRRSRNLPAVGRSFPPNS